MKDDIVAGSSQELTLGAHHRVLATLLTVLGMDLQDLHVPPLGISAEAVDPLVQEPPRAGGVRPNLQPVTVQHLLRR
jgi:hypothetical protein